MRIAVCHKPHQISVETRPIPDLDGDKILVRVALCGICGSDLALWDGSERKYPYTPGHEFSGRVERVGSKVRDISPGQRVVIDPNLGCGECPYCRRGLPNLCDFLKSRPIKSNGGFSEFVSLDHRMAHPLPPSLTDEQATFVEPLSCAIRIVEVAEAMKSDTVVIFGGGILGILVGTVLASRGNHFLYIEPRPQRRRQLKTLFNTECLIPEQLVDSKAYGQFDVAIDCSGNPKALAQAISILSKAGTLVLAGLVKSGKIESSVDQITRKELKLKGAWLNPNTFTDAITLTVKSRSLLRRLDTKTFPLSEIEQAFECAAQKRFNKVFVRP